jgi:hypothetical protein
MVMALFGLDPVLEVVIVIGFVLIGINFVLSIKGKKGEC